MHVEIPRLLNLKLLSLSRMIVRTQPATIIDGCAGVGTLGIAASLAGMPHVILNDRWHAAAFWSAVNISVNCTPLGIDEFLGQVEQDEFLAKKVRRCPIEVASASGDTARLEVWYGDFRCLPRRFAVSADFLCIFDPFEKSDRYGKNHDRLENPLAAGYLCRKPQFRVIVMFFIVGVLMCKREERPFFKNCVLLSDGRGKRASAA